MLGETNLNADEDAPLAVTFARDWISSMRTCSTAARTSTLPPSTRLTATVGMAPASVGASVGADVATAVGASVGAEVLVVLAPAAVLVVGSPVGAVGRPVGRPVGAPVGAVGRPVGKPVGAPVEVSPSWPWWSVRGVEPMRRQVSLIVRRTA